MKTELELVERNLAISKYADSRGVSVDWVHEFKSIVPARLDRPCDYPGCTGWHFLPKGFYTQADVDCGFVPAEILEWQ